MAPTHDPKDWRNHNWTSQSADEMINQSTGFVKLRSRDDKHVALIHKELLCFFSPYYAAALRGSFIESTQDTLSVELDANELKCFTTWIYTGNLGAYLVTDTSLPMSVRLYLFADQTEVLALRRALMTWVVGTADTKPYYDSVMPALSGLPDTSPMYRYMVDKYINHWYATKKSIADYESVSNLEDTGKKLSDFLFQVTCGLPFRDELGAGYCPCCVNSCNYHEHESEEEWNSTCGIDEDKELPEGKYLQKTIPKLSDEERCQNSP